MTKTELNKIILSEVRRDGYLSKGTRIAIIEHADAGDTFSFIASEADRRLLCPAMSGKKRMRTQKVAPNAVLFYIN